MFNQRLTLTDANFSTYNQIHSNAWLDVFKNPLKKTQRYQVWLDQPTVRVADVFKVCSLKSSASWYTPEILSHVNACWLIVVNLSIKKLSLVENNYITATYHVVLGCVVQRPNVAEIA